MITFPNHRNNMEDFEQEIPRLHLTTDSYNGLSMTETCEGVEVAKKE